MAIYKKTVLREIQVGCQQAAQIKDFDFACCLKRAMQKIQPEIDVIQAGINEDNEIEVNERIAREDIELNFNQINMSYIRDKKLPVSYAILDLLEPLIHWDI